MSRHIPQSKLREAALDVSSLAEDFTLQEHLAECAACSAILTDERVLLGAIDGAINASVSEDDDPIWTSRVRKRLVREVTLDRAPSTAWLPLAAGALAVAVGIVIWSTARYPFRLAEPKSSLVTEVSRHPVVPGAKPSPASNGESLHPSVNAASAQASMAQARRPYSTEAAHASASANIRIDPEEWHSFVRFDAALKQNSIDSGALMASVRLDDDSPAPADLQVDPIEIPSLQPEPTPEPGGDTR